MKKQYDRESAVRLLVNMRAACLPVAKTVTHSAMIFRLSRWWPIKAFLGPWPRALEAAGIKPPRDPAFREKQLQKRIAQRRRATQCKIEKQRQIRDSRA